MWQWFKSFFSEEGGASTTRALNWFWFLSICFSIVFCTIKTAGHLPEIPTAYIAISTALLAAKVGQRALENKE